MKNQALLLLSILILSLTACDEGGGFDVTATWKEIPVVYGLLDAKEDTHFIRIQRAYLINGDANSVATINDSIYYKDVLNVSLQQIDGPPAFNLERVDGNTIGRPKEPGTFSTDPNWLYRYVGPVFDQSSYKLNIENTASGNDYTASTKIVDQFNSSFPIKGVTIDFSTEQLLEFSWFSAVDGIAYDLIVRLNYDEWNVNTPLLVTEKHVDWLVFRNKLGTTTDGGEKLFHSQSGDSFFGAIANSVSKDDNLVRRVNPTKQLEFIYYTAGQDLSNYLRVRDAQTGLTSNEALPVYTNLSGDAIGIFSSRTATVIDSILLSTRSIDSLACGSITKGLNFQDKNGAVGCQ